MRVEDHYPILQMRVSALTADHHEHEEDCKHCGGIASHLFTIFTDTAYYTRLQERYPTDGRAVANEDWRQTLRTQIKKGPDAHIEYSSYCLVCSLAHIIIALQRISEFYSLLFLRFDEQACVLFRRAGYPKDMRITLVPIALSPQDIVQYLYKQPRENDLLLGPPPSVQQA